MKIVTKRDVVSALITGLTTGVIAWRILVFLEMNFGVPLVLLALVTPIFWVAGVQLGYALGVLWAPMTQFGRFVAVGFANAMVDFGILYFFIALTEIAGGIGYAAFKGISFLVAVVHSYLWNKYWSFEAGSSSGGVSEIGRFIIVALVAVVVNVGVASAVVLSQPTRADPHVWAGIGAIAGSASALIFSFIGFRIFVFRRK